jgi:menaquinone-9 beta-reductase
VEYDILILGGGPSGLSSALHLAKLAPDLAPRILILEKAHYPRQKLCAGGLVSDAEIILGRLGLDVSEIPHVDVAKVHFDFAGSGLALSAPKTHSLRVIRRNEFDAWLAQKVRDTGIEIREGITVVNIEPRQECVVVETDTGTFTGQVVIGADGSNGVTHRCVRPNGSVHTARVLEVITPINESHPADHAYFDFFPVPDGIAGYTWDFPSQINGQPMRCWGVYDTNILAEMQRPPLKQPLLEEMARRGFDMNKYEIKGFPIRWFSPFNQFSVRRVILVGDAAGADGIFGEGISMALGYGHVAAEVVRDAFLRNDFSFGDYRRRILFSPLGQNLSIRAAITYILYHLHWSWFQKFFWRTCGPVVAIMAWIFVINWARRMK